MMFHTATFILGFLPIFLVGLFALRRYGTTGALIWVLACSLVFYAWWNPWHLPLLLGSVAVNYRIANRLRSSSNAGAWLAGGVGMNLCVLGWFKYADFLLHSIDPERSATVISLPLAISFFTFQQIMFLVDTWHLSTSPSGDPDSLLSDRPLLRYAVFVTFFPHLIAGPIVRPVEIMPQLTGPNFGRLRLANLSDGLLLFLLGLGKKFVLADMFGGFAGVGFDAALGGAQLTFFEAWYAALSYALQIYFDFSGYSDMAIGLARMVGIRFPLNFDSPYQATDITAFWRRWHITLGAFLRDYLYVPLGGNRRGPTRQLANLMITMLLGGLWHGAGWNFVLWGGLHGMFLATHRLYRRHFPEMPDIIGRLLTLLVVIVAWVPFRAQSLTATLGMLRGMVGCNGVALPRMIVGALPPIAAFAEPVPILPYLGDARTLSFPEISVCLLLGWLIVLAMPNVHRMSLAVRYRTLTVSFALSMQALFFAPNVAPFLYFQF